VPEARAVTGTVMITGAAGFLGRLTGAEAIRRGFTTGGVGHVRPGTAPPALDAFIAGSVSEAALDAVASRTGRPDIVVHLAGGSAVGPSFADPTADFERTVTSTARLIDWMRLHAPDARLVAASSAAVYGAGHGAPIAEGAPLAPFSPYATHKRAMELAIEDAARDFGLRVCSVRLFSVYGPGLGKQLLFDLGRRLAAGERTVTLGGSGAEARDFLYGEDAARLLLDAAAWAGVGVALVNGGTGRAVTVAEIAECMAAVWNPNDPARIAFSGEVRQGDPAFLVADVTRLSDAGFTPRIGLSEGLARTIVWQRGIFGAEGAR